METKDVDQDDSEDPKPQSDEPQPSPETIDSQKVNAGPKVDIIALHLLIRKLFQTPNTDIQKNPAKWIEGVGQCKLLMEKIFDMIQDQDSSNKKDECGSLWRKLEMKKLFFEQVVMKRPADARTGTKPIKTLVEFFTGDVSNAIYHQKGGFDKVVASLQKIIGTAIRSLHKNCPRKCPGCAKAIGSPVKLPECGHFFCQMCTNQVTSCQTSGCDKQVPEGYIYTPDDDTTIDKESLTDFKAFRQSVDEFFMQFVSKLVFGFGTTPDLEIVEWLSTHISFRDGSKKFSLFMTDEVVDATKTLRSFFVKLLLQRDGDVAIIDHLNSLINSWKDGDNISSQLSKLLLVMNCYKAIHGQFVHDSFQPPPSQALEDSESQFIEHMKQSHVVSYRSLTTMSDLQCALSRVVDELFLHSADNSHLQGSLQKVLLGFSESGYRQPRYYVIRQLRALRGESFIKDLINTQYNFLVPPEVQDVLASFSVPDVFLLSDGEFYNHAKRLIDGIISGSEKKEIDVAVESLMTISDNHRTLTLLHAIFTRITRTFADPVHASAEVCFKFLSAAQRHTPLSSHHVQLMLKVLLEKDGLPAEMSVKQSKGINLAMLVIHLFTAVINCTSSHDLYPLKEIISDPQLASQHYTPTMKENPVENLRLQQLKLEGNKSANLVAYRCQCGVIYFIGECGQAWTVQRCPKCKAEIGGEWHKLVKTSHKIPREEAESQPGHILGHAVNREKTALGERQLSALSTAVLRMLTHLSMFASMLQDINRTATLIKPALKSIEDIGSFLEAHIQADLQHIAECCGESTDNCILLVHQVIGCMSQGPKILSKNDCILDKTEKRERWEAFFDEQYMKPVFADKGARLKKAKEILTKAASNDLDQVLSAQDASLVDLTAPGLWEYSRPLTAEVILNMINADEEEYPVLKAMVENCDALVAVSCLPDILLLVKLISEKFYSRFNREQAKDLLMTEFIDKHAAVLNLSELRLRKMVQNYVRAWNIAVASGKLEINEPIPMDNEPKLISFLNDKHNRQNSYPLKLITYLVDTHNQVVTASNSQRKATSLWETTPSTLVNLSNRDELISVVDSHSEYTHTTSTSVEYNLQAAEQEATLRFVGTRARIDFLPSHLPPYMFNEDFNLWDQMKALTPTQERLDKAMQQSMNTTVSNSSVQVLTTNLRALTITINYLSAMSSYDHEGSLAEFIENTVGSPMIFRVNLKLKHSVHVWFLFKYAQTDALMRNGQSHLMMLMPLTLTTHLMMLRLSLLESVLTTAKEPKSYSCCYLSSSP